MQGKFDFLSNAKKLFILIILQILCHNVQKTLQMDIFQFVLKIDCYK